MEDGGTKRLLAYLNDRLANGEVINAESPVLAPDYVYKTYRGSNAGKPFLPTQQVSKRKNQRDTQTKVRLAAVRL
jgi:hypothetical protein